jgi:hypothetical protein
MADIDTENCEGKDPYFKKSPSTAVGLKGDKGDTGEKGDPGAVTTVVEGSTITVINNNLHINNVDTGVRVEIPNSVDVPVMSSFDWMLADNILRIRSKDIRTVAGVLEADAEGDEVEIEIEIDPDDSTSFSTISSITESDGTVTVNTRNLQTEKGVLTAGASSVLLTFDLGGGVPAGYEEIDLEICVSGSPVTRTFLVKTLP